MLLMSNFSISLWGLTSCVGLILLDSITVDVKGVEIIIDIRLFEDCVQPEPDLKLVSKLSKKFLVLNYLENR